MNNLFRNLMRASNPDWEYKWKITLPADLVVEVDLDCRAVFENEWFRIEPLDPGKTRMTCKKGYSWDGCSVVPDAPGTERASCIHDELYQWAAPIANAWGCTVNTVLYWANHAFLQVMRQDKSPVAGLYYAGVQVFGPLYHTIAGWF
jgi:hypothetical protein